MNKNNYFMASLITVMVAFMCCTLFLAYSWTVSGASVVQTKLLIDHDGGADDAMAIFEALLYEKYFQGPEVVALNTIFGNVDENQAFNNTQRILDVADRRDVPIYRGCSKSLISNYPTDHYFGYDGLGDKLKDPFEPIDAQNEYAAVALIEMSKKYKDKLIVVTLGALTNIAIALRLDPNFSSRLSHLYIAAGNIYGDDFREPEFNAAMDPESYHIVIEKCDPEKTTIVPFSQIRKAKKISKNWRKNVLGSIESKIMKAQNTFEAVSIESSSDYWSLLDPSAMAIVLAGDSIVEDTRRSDNDIIICGDQRGVNTNNFTSEANAKLVYKINQEAYKKFLIDVFSAELKK